MESLLSKGPTPSSFFFFQIFPTGILDIWVLFHIQMYIWQPWRNLEMATNVLSEILPELIQDQHSQDHHYQYHNNYTLGHTQPLHPRVSWRPGGQAAGQGGRGSPEEGQGRWIFFKIVVWFDMEVIFFLNNICTHTTFQYAVQCLYGSEVPGRILCRMVSLFLNFGA